MLSTGQFDFTAVPFNLARHFNRDVVANPGDRTGDNLDSSAMLIVNGFDGRRSDNPVAGGLPLAGVLGVHRLGDYSQKNTLQLTRASLRDVRIDTEPGRYCFVRFLVAGGSGDSMIPVVFQYEDGTYRRETLPCDDWYESDPPDRPPQKLRSGAVPILSGMDRIRRGRYKDNNRPAIYEVTLAADSARVLRSIRLERARAVFDSSSTKFNLFAVTGIRVE